MTRVSVDDLKQMRLSGQIIRTDKLLTILDQHGFVTRRSGGGTSHIFVWNPDHPEIDTFVIVAETNNPIYQRISLDACIQVHHTKHTPEENKLDVVAEFEVAAENKFILPKEFEIVRGRKKPGTYLRHKKYPQIATELTNYDHGKDISEWCDYLTDRVRKLEVVLTDAVENHDFERTNYPNGTIILMHPSHRVYTALYPFTPRLQNFTCIRKVEDCIAEVQLIQEDYNQLLDDIVDFYSAELSNLECSIGKRFEFRDLFAEQTKLSVTLPTTKNGYFSFPDFVTFAYEFDKEAWKNCKNDLKRYYGFEVTQTSDRRLHGKHALLDVQFTIPDVRKIPSPDERLKHYYDLSPEEQDAFTQELYADFDVRNDAHNTVFDAMDKVREISEPRANECMYLLKHLSSKLPLHKKPVFGEMIVLPLQNANGDKMNLRVLALSAGVASVDTSPKVLHIGRGHKGYEPKREVGMIIIPTAEDLEQLRVFVASKTLRLSGFAGASFEQSSSPKTIPLLGTTGLNPAPSSLKSTSSLGAIGAINPKFQI